MDNQTISLTEHFANQSDIVKSIFKEFTKPIFGNVFFTNLSALRKESNLYEFKNDSWSQRPMVFCLDCYEEPSFYPVIMLVNNIKSFLEFVPVKFQLIKNQRVIIAPYRQSIIKILNTSDL